MPAKRTSWLPDPLMIVLLATILLSLLFPCRGSISEHLHLLATVSVTVLFFMHGAKLSAHSVLAGLIHWRLHLLVLGTTFVIFPAVALALRPLLQPLVTQELYVGVLFLCMLPSTVQSSIAFTALARGNIPAAICSASLSNLLGIVLSPLLVSLFVSTQTVQGRSTLDSIGKIALQLLLPFALGQISRRWIGAWVERHKPMLRWVDQSSVVLVVYTAFSDAAASGLMHSMPARAVLGVCVVSIVILAIIMSALNLATDYLGLTMEDRIAIFFCGSKKSIISGMPLARVLFSGPALGFIVLPLIVFHQIQLLVCAVLARRFASRP
jgi:sodium/bile acid cotransporter 7